MQTINLYISSIETITEQQQSDIYNSLNIDRKKRANIFTDDTKKSRFLYAEALSEFIVRKDLGVDEIKFSGIVGNKPYLEDYPNLSISRSYAGNYVLIGIDTSSDIGVDIELKNNYTDTVGKYFFTDEEKKYIEESKDKSFAFSLIWTRKESYIKCIGKGLYCSLQSINLAPNSLLMCEDLNPLFEQSDCNNDFYIRSYTYKDFVISICNHKNNNFPCIKELDININSVL